MSKEFYQNPLCERYSGDRMKRIFSPDNRYYIWRRLWLSLAEGERRLGLNITQDQIDEMKANLKNIDYQKVAEYESSTRHDVMAHILAFGDVCPKAKPIIHLGATSCFVGDNGDIIMYREGLKQVKNRLIGVLSALKDFALRHKDLKTLAYTHFQAAQPTTVGKRATLWAQDLLLDLERLDNLISSLKLLGCKGTTGTCASFLQLLKTTERVEALEDYIAKDMGFEGTYAVSGQTYSRKIDYFILSVLSGIAQSASKFANDVRLLSHLKEVDEPFEKGQVGSSAMAYKRNPMRSERICSLARLVICNGENPAITAATQWFERTLDDSANRRISIPESFVAIDGILNLYGNVISGMTVYPYVIDKHLKEELPFMATENILMYCVERGGDRQALHERIRELSVESAKSIKLCGKANDLLERILSDSAFNLTKKELDDIVNVDNFVGLAPKQTEDFCQNILAPAIEGAGFGQEDFTVNV